MGFMLIEDKAVGSLFCNILAKGVYLYLPGVSQKRPYAGLHRSTTLLRETGEESGRHGDSLFLKYVQLE
jgi:hypothetical protein